MKGKITAVLFILVFLLVVAVVFTFLTSLDRRREAEANQPINTDVVVTENTPAPTEAPAEAAPQQTILVTPAPANTPAVPAAAPAETPSSAVIDNGAPVAAVIETPAPAAAPSSVGTTPSGTLLGSGTFSSRTGAAINIHADWEARVSNAEEISILVTVTLDSYSIYVNNLPDSVNIGLNGQYVSLESPAITYDSNTTQLHTELGKQSFTVQLPEGSSRDLDLQCEWHWGGRYGGMDIPVIECGGTFSVNR